MKVVLVLFITLSILEAKSLLTTLEIDAVLSIHNEARAKVCLHGLEWDEAAASAAQQYLDNNNRECPTDHSSQSSRDSAYKNFGGTCSNPTFKICSIAMLGENIASGSIGYYDAADLVKLWINEKSLFSCGILPSFQQDSGHYSQVVWEGTRKVGCGIRDCSDGFTTLLCNYYPSGNINSETTLAFPAENCNEICTNQTSTDDSLITNSTDLAQNTTVMIPSETLITPQPTTKSQEPSIFTLLSSTWSPLVGTINDWNLSNSDTLNHISSDNSAITLIGSTSSTEDGTDVFIVADINPETSTKYGLVINAKVGSDGLQFHSFKYDGGKYKICYAYANRPYYDCCGIYKDIPPHGLFMMRHTIVGNKHYYKGYIGDKALSTYILDNTWGGGEQGISASGNANFKNFYVRTPTTVKFTLTTCTMTSADIINLISSQLGINPSLVLNIQKFGCTMKREVQAETVTAMIVGSESSTSLELAKQLISNPSASMTSVSIESSIKSDIIESEAISLSATPILVSLSIGAIAGIVAGSVTGAVGIGIGIYFATKSKSKTQITVQESNEVAQDKEATIPTQNIPTPNNLKVKGVDVFNMDPNNHQSLTARNPNINNPNIAKV